MDREAWHAAVDGVSKSRTWLSSWTELNWNRQYLWQESSHWYLSSTAPPSNVSSTLFPYYLKSFTIPSLLALSSPAVWHGTQGSSLSIPSSVSSPMPCFLHPHTSSTYGHCGGSYFCLFSYFSRIYLFIFFFVLSRWSILIIWDLAGYTKSLQRYPYTLW